MRPWPAGSLCVPEEKKQQPPPPQQQQHESSTTHRSVIIASTTIVISCCRPGPSSKLQCSRSFPLAQTKGLASQLASHQGSVKWAASRLTPLSFIVLVEEYHKWRHDTHMIRRVETSCTLGTHSQSSSAHPESMPPAPYNWPLAVAATASRCGDAPALPKLLAV